jgi:hypothetical protein
MSVKEKLHKLGVEVEPECLQAIESGGQVYQIGLCGIIQNPDRANYTQFAALSFPAPSFLVENQGVCAERFGQYDGFTFAWVKLCQRRVGWRSDFSYFEPGWRACNPLLHARRRFLGLKLADDSFWDDYTAI